MTSFSPTHISFSTVSARLESKQRRPSTSSSTFSSSSSFPSTSSTAGGGVGGSRMPWKAREIEKLLRKGYGARRGEKMEKGSMGLEKERVERVLSEYIRDKRSSARTTKHIDRKLTLLERNVADLGLHESFDAARKKDGKLGNGPLIDLGLDRDLIREDLPLYSEKGTV